MIPDWLRLRFFPVSAFPGTCKSDFFPFGQGAGSEVAWGLCIIITAYTKCFRKKQFQTKIWHIFWDSRRIFCGIIILDTDGSESKWGNFSRYSLISSYYCRLAHVILLTISSFWPVRITQVHHLPLWSWQKDRQRAQRRGYISREQVMLKFA